MRHSRSQNTDPNTCLKCSIRKNDKCCQFRQFSITDSGWRMAQLLRHLDTHNAYGDHIGKHLLRCHSLESLFPVKALFVLSLAENPFPSWFKREWSKGESHELDILIVFPSFYSLLENQVQRFCLFLCSLLRDFDFENAYRKCRWPALQLPQKSTGRWEHS